LIVAGAFAVLVQTSHLPRHGREDRKKYLRTKNVIELPVKKKCYGNEFKSTGFPMQIISGTDVTPSYCSLVEVRAAAKDSRAVPCYAAL